MKSHFGNLVSLQEGIKDFVRENRLEKGFDKLNVREAWFRLMGKSIASYTTDVQFKEGTLFVYLSSSTLREELSFGKEKIANLMNEELGKVLIKKVVLM
ncbi:MAG: DUF721 domain-containing protein [Bacteroidetes bacterium]|nr:DUF721 domain-containing protein [Bacteroidota bacterium]